MNRGQLRLSILAWLHRSNLNTPVSATWDPTVAFTALAEQDINEKLRARCMVIRTSEPVTGQYLTLPCDYLEAFDVRLGNGGPELLYLPRAETAQAVYAHSSSGAAGDPNRSGYAPDYMPSINPSAVPWNNGQPKFYSVVGSEMEFVPFPDSGTLDANGNPVSFLVELAYYQRQALGPDDTDTTPVLASYQAIYLYGCLLQAAPFLRDDQRVATWGQLYQNAITGANAEHERSRTQGSRLVQRYRRLA